MTRKWNYYSQKELWVKEESKNSQKYFDIKTWQLAELGEIDLSQEEKMNPSAFKKMQQSVY